MLKKPTQRRRKGFYDRPAPAPPPGAPDPPRRAAPVLTCAFELRDDGTIDATATDEAEPAPEAAAPFPAPPSPPRIAYRDDRHGLWLYHGNCLELLDAVAAKHPDGRFDRVFADPPYFGD